MDGKKGLLFALMILIIVPLAYAEDVKILLKDPQGNALANTEILYELADKSGQATTDTIGQIILPVSSSYRIIYDDQRTPGYDLYAKTTLSNNEMILTMRPVGSLRIIVVDAKSVPVGDALVRIDCSNNYGEQGYFYSDEFGVVSAKYLPESMCSIKSAAKDSITNESVEISEGDNKEVTLKFADYVQKSNNILLPMIVLLIFIIVIVYVIMYYSQNKHKETKTTKKRVERIDEDKHIGSAKEDIITALDRKEKDVIRFLLKELSDKDSVSQSKIVYGLGMAKTSLTRILMNLEAKNLIKIEKIGKLKKISLSDWFKKK